MYNVDHQRKNAPNANSSQQMTSNPASVHEPSGAHGFENNAINKNGVMIVRLIQARDRASQRRVGDNSAAAANNDVDNSILRSHRKQQRQTISVIVNRQEQTRLSK